jgi:glycosyltransferase involved in cell wall biosynthesis
LIKTLTSTLNALRSASANVALDLANGKDVAEKIRIIQNSGIFDPDFYAAQIGQTKMGYYTAIAHYLNEGAKDNLDPYPLFNTSFYVNNNSYVDFNTYNPLLHFIVEGGKKGRDPHPLFESQFYINTYLDVRQSAINPLVHYIHFGAKEKRSPAFTFDAVRYTKRAQEADLRGHFAERLAGSKLKFLRKARTLEIPRASALFKHVQKFFKKRENLLLYFLSQGIEKGVFPFPSFELLYEICPPTEVEVSNGIKAKTGQKFSKVIPRAFNNYQSLPAKFRPFFKKVAEANLPKDKYGLYKELVQSLTLKKDGEGFLDSNKIIILFSHVASLTGSPLLLLQIAKGLSADGWECLLFLEKEGELEKDFSEIAHVINFQELMGRETKCEQYLSLLFEDLHFKKPKISIVNSLETGAYTKAMNKAGIKAITLVHELVDTYSLSFLKDVFKRSQLAVFPAKFVRDFANNRVGKELNACPQIIMPNALLNPEFGNYDQLDARKLLREEIGANPDSLIVIGCGSPEMRKGFDLFILAARIVMSKWKKHPEKFSNRPIHFVWIGADSVERFSPHYYITWDIKQGNLSSYIHLLQSRKDLRPAFHGADIFVLPSRKDPFPCVVHDAMAARLPIISFDNAGGVPEMVEGGGAKIIPYGDIVAFAEAIEEYLTDNEQRLKDGATNAKLVAERFRFTDYISQLEKQIEKLIN